MANNLKRGFSLVLASIMVILLCPFNVSQAYGFEEDEEGYYTLKEGEDYFVRDEEYNIVAPKQSGNFYNWNTSGKTVTLRTMVPKGYGGKYYGGNKGPSKIIIPEGIEAIAEGNYKNAGITDIKFPKSLQYIGDDMFSGNELSGTLSLPNVWYVGSSAFENNKITKLDTPNLEMVDVYGFKGNLIDGKLKLDKLKFLSWYAFENNQIDEVDLPNLEVATKEVFKSNPLKKANAPKMIHSEDPSFDEVIKNSEKMADKYEPKAKDIEIRKGEFFEVKDVIENYKDLPTDTEFHFKKNPDLETPGTQEVVVTVKYSDGTTDEVKFNLTVKEIFYKVTFKYGNDTEDKTVEVAQGKTVAEPQAPKKDGFKFVGWFVGDEKFDFNKEVNGNITVAAKWEKVELMPVPKPTPTPSPQPVPPVIIDRDDYIGNRHGKANTDNSGVSTKKNLEKKMEKPVEQKNEEKIEESKLIIPKATLKVNLTDIPEGEVGEAIKNMVSRGILKGMDNGKFEGKLPITRAMVAEVLMRLSKDNTKAEVNAPDVKPTDWFNDSIKWAVKHGVLKGYEDGSFKPNQKVTRQEFALIIYRFLKEMGIHMDKMLMTNYKDMDTIPSWAKEAVISMLRSGLIMGETKDYYNGASDFTREELAMTLHKIVTWVENFN